MRKKRPAKRQPDRKQFERYYTYLKDELSDEIDLQKLNRIARGLANYTNVHYKAFIISLLMKLAEIDKKVDDTRETLILGITAALYTLAKTARLSEEDTDKLFDDYHKEIELDIEKTAKKKQEVRQLNKLFLLKSRKPRR